MEKEEQQVEQTTRRMSFDPKSLLKDGDCKFQSDMGGDVKLNMKSVRQIASVADDVALTDTECLVFIRKCETWKLDPFLGEIFLIKGKKGPAATIVAADAYLRKVDVHKDYDGYKTGWMVKEGEGDEKVALLCLEPLAPISANQEIVGSWCEVFRKGRRTPIQKTFTNEVIKKDWNGKALSIWAIMPLSQTVKCNIAQAHRRVFPGVLAGIYTTDERSDLFVRDIQEEFHTDNMPQTVPRDERTEDKPTTITLGGVQTHLIEVFYGQCREINSDATNVDIETAFYNFMATRFGGDVDDWTTLENPVWTIKRGNQALATLESEGISDGLARMYLGIKEIGSELDATGGLLPSADESEAKDDSKTT